MTSAEHNDVLSPEAQGGIFNRIRVRISVILGFLGLRASRLRFLGKLCSNLTCRLRRTVARTRNLATHFHLAQ